MLKRLIANALSNGERYAKELIQITLTPAEKYVTCTIIDDGPGISDEELELFGERKYGRKYSSAFGHLSMGLGSLIMKKITAQLGGHLKIERRKNAEGTTLTLVLLLSSQ